VVGRHDFSWQNVFSQKLLYQIWLPINLLLYQTVRWLEKNKKTIRYFYEESLKGNLAVYDELFTPDFVTLPSR